MNRQQLSAVRRVLKREKKNCKNDDLFQRPGLHPSMGRHLATDGHIAILLDSPLKNVPVGSCMDSLGGTIYKECNRGEHFPLDDTEIMPELWTKLRADDYDLGPVEMTAYTRMAMLSVEISAPRACWTPGRLWGRTPASIWASVGWGGSGLPFWSRRRKAASQKG